MGKRTYDDQHITEYLLGSLSEEETERLDELSFTDDEFAARLQAVENDLVDAYVGGQLSGQTLERFDLHYLSSPKRREKVAIARGLKDFVGRAVITEPAKKQASFAKDKQASRWDSLRQYFFVPKLQWGLAAAVLLVLAAGGWLAIDNLRLRHQVNQAQAAREELQRRERELQEQLAGQHSSDAEKEKELAGLREQIARLEQQAAEPPRPPSPPPSGPPHIVSFILAPQLRGAGQIAPISIPADADYVDLRLDLESGNYPAYRAELQAQPGNQVVWRSGRLRARARGDGKAVIVRLRPVLLKSQRYALEVSGISGEGRAEIVGSYLFRVTKQ